MIAQRRNLLGGVLLTATLAISASAQDFDLSRHTIDNGGGYSAGANFELGGTIGQPDAGYMSGGVFEMEGGFWPSSAIPSCACLGDMNGDGIRNGDDIQKFVDCVIVGGDCLCADVDEFGGVTINDAAIFVDDLLLATDCP